MTAELPPGRIVRAPEVLSRALDDDLVLYHPVTDDVTHLDAIARAVWEQLAVEPTGAELVSTLVERFSADDAIVRRDVIKLLGELEAAQLVSFGAGGTAP